MGDTPDAVVVGAGPNGLAAAIELARAGRSVLVLERAADVGGGTRTAELTLPGFRHDVCSAVHPLAAASPFLRGLPLERFGLELIEPEVPAAHPLDDGSAAVLHRSLTDTSAGLGRDGDAYSALLEPFVSDWERLAEVLLGPPLAPAHPLLAARFAARGAAPAAAFARLRFREEAARALFAGMAAHSIRPLGAPATSAFALLLMTLGHSVGWPFARGGSQAIAHALRGYLESLGGIVETGHAVASLEELPAAKAILFDTSPAQLAAICGDALPARYRSRLDHFRPGPGVFKVDYALAEPSPWRAEECRQAGTIHLGGTLAEIAASERAVAAGRHPERPYVLVAQPSIADPTRVPDGRHTLWAYCHVPNGSTVDMTAAIEAQLERFAPGFRDVIVAQATRKTKQLELENPNYAGGDISGGAASLRQLIARPVASRCPYATPNPRLFLCSASTSPGAGVHGMCGYNAARAALARGPWTVRTRPGRRRPVL
ncbi:MAG TPA: NAD(P)/FAD-dependent oxidoreductase [Thermoleophilaceae bacterium]